MMKSRRMIWAGHLTHMGEKGNDVVGRIILK
jgi:hypothetical protein